MQPDPSALAASFAPLVAAYCRRPAVRHELGLSEGTLLEASLLSRSAYTLTYLVQAPDTRRWLARLSIGSPFGLSSSKQIAYEARALRLLEPFRIAPQLCYVDATLYHLPYGFLVMEYLSGEPLEPSNSSHLRQAARLLARLHTIPIPGDTGIIRNAYPLSSLIDEAAHYQSLYAASPTTRSDVLDLLQSALTAARRALINEPRFHAATLVHNDLHLHNWIVAPSRPALLPLAGIQPLGSSTPALRLINWIQPLLDDPTNDLCNLFSSIASLPESAPTYTAARQETFLASYLQARPDLDATDLRDRLALRLRFVYLRTFSMHAVSQTQQSINAVSTNTPSSSPPYLHPDHLRPYFGDWL